MAAVEDFADPASIKDDLLCSICTGVFLDPQSCPCGHTFCGFCLKQWLGQSACCPLCRAVVEQSELVGCVSLREECDALQVTCPWRCGWQGRRGEVAAHSTDCPVSYYVDLTLPVDGSLGICFEVLDGVMFVCSLQDDGAAKKHNEAHEGHEDRQIRVNDEVVRVNGVAGDAAMLAYLFKRPGRKSITVRHPQELAVNVQRQGRKALGIDISWSSNHGILTIVGVDDGGAVEESSKSENAPSKQLLRHDRIIEVNGVSCVGKPDSVVSLLRESEKCIIKLHRPRRYSVCSL